MVQLAYRVADRFRRVYWFVFRPTTTGCKCVIEHDGRWLMIRNTYGRGHWTFPGGAVERGESPDDAAKREVREEVGVWLRDVEPIGSCFSDRQYKRDTVHCFFARVSSPEHTIDPKEIAEAAWIPPETLPNDRGPVVDKIVAMLAKLEL